MQARFYQPTVLLSNAFNIGGKTHEKNVKKRRGRYKKCAQDVTQKKAQKKP
jgi:hypothetical protein